MKEEFVNEFGIELAIQMIAPMITEKIMEYNKKTTKELKKEIIQLISDRDAIYSNDKEIIKKYIWMEGDKYEWKY